MKKTLVIASLFLMTSLIIFSCNHQEEEQIDKVAEKEMSMKGMKMAPDNRISLKLNPMQKKHQLMNMRSHLEAVQQIVALLSSEKYEEASKVAYEKLGSTTEMKLMCASFGDKNFEELGLKFHASADKMSEIIKSKDKNKSLEALATTINYCVQCHSTYRQ